MKPDVHDWMKATGVLLDLALEAKARAAVVVHVRSLAVGMEHVRHEWVCSPLKLLVLSHDAEHVTFKAAGMLKWDIHCNAEHVTN